MLKMPQRTIINEGIGKKARQAKRNVKGRLEDVDEVYPSHGAGLF